LSVKAAEKQAWSVVSHSSIEASMWFGQADQAERWVYSLSFANSVE